MAEQKIDVKKVADLARLRLGKDEERYLQNQFQKILGYIDTISEVEVVGTEAEEKDESLLNIFREDYVKKSGINPESFSPYLENKHFKVPKVIE